ncbi:immune-associated nucleotide-binding protein 7 [Elysia marginata]|uniref:Immune-associated nucleotide-binding protein 7 n=1 Tax=Elysia marginata TaxID=1093978 RepID=A0AAV4FNF7_9GAST|nr:immune-associated nucleotide-binding protein 7 [Elysia marginata]
MISILKLSFCQNTEEATTVDLILVGRTGEGKSRTGNSILDSQSFEVSNHTYSETANVCWGSRDYNGKELVVLDTPGLKDTRRTVEEGSKMIHKMLKEQMIISPKGYSAFLYIIKYPLRVTEDNMRDIKMFEQILNTDFARSHGILVMTGGDSFDADKPDGQLFEDWCRREEGNFQKLRRKFRNRVILFDNMTQDETKKCEQLNRLLSSVETLEQSNGRYTDNQFESGSFKDVSDVTFRLLLTTLQQPITVDDLPDLSSKCAQHKRVISKSAADKLETIRVQINKTFRESRKSTNSQENSASTFSEDINMINDLASNLQYGNTHEAAITGGKLLLGPQV